MKVLLTGAAGFIGFHVTRRLLSEGCEVVGIDDFNDYYDVGLKRARVAELLRSPRFRLVEGDLAAAGLFASIVDEVRPTHVIHLAAQPGVRYSLENPDAYISSNLVAFARVLEGCRNVPIEHLVYASSSSVYGGRETVPFSVDDSVDRPVSLYAATKKSNELMAHAYSHLFGIPATGLRFFTVYGPWGRPDMAYFSFTKAIIDGMPIRLFNGGEMERDFTFVDDIVEGVWRILLKPPLPRNGEGRESAAPYAIYNIGGGDPVPLRRFVAVLEALIDRPAVVELAPMQPGDVPRTFADTSALEAVTGFKPRIGIEAGLREFVSWYREYYGAI